MNTKEHDIESPHDESVACHTLIVERGLRTLLLKEPT
jgi:hypothetical protein